MTVAEEYIDLANRLADRARAIVREYAGAFEVRYKEDGSPVTVVDLAVEAALREIIEREAPDHGTLGEEHAPVGLDRDHVWILDPIDGTRQFSCGLPNFGVLIALCHKGVPVLGVIEQPLTGYRCLGAHGHATTMNGRAVRARGCSTISAAIANLADPDCIDEHTSPGFEAVRGATRWNVYDGGCLGFASLACGHLDLCLYGSNVDPFDICALAPVVEGAGGQISTWSGDPITMETTGEIFASASEALHAEVLELLRSATG